jgi:glycosyltransferase involved in cell wall biosynthesis
MPKVSVIIPTYQRANIVSQAIKSVLAQTYQDYEIIVVNDGSTDNTPEALGQFGNEIKIIHQTNQGLSAARNTGIRASQGDYIAFLDDDDLWETHKLETQIPILESQHKIGLIYSDMFFFSGQDLLPGSYNTSYPTPPIQLLWNLFYQNYIPVPTVVVRRECLDEVGLFDETLTSCEDYDLWLRIIAKFPIHFVNDLLARYRLSENSMSQNIERMIFNCLRVKEKALNNNPQLQQFPLYYLDRCYYIYYLELTRVYIQQGEQEKAHQVLCRYRQARGITPAYSDLYAQVT